MTDEPRCPRCDAAINVERVADLDLYVSDCCGKPFPWPPAEKIRGEAEDVPAVPEALSRDVYGRTQPHRERNGKRIEFG